MARLFFPCGQIHGSTDIAAISEEDASTRTGLSDEAVAEISECLRHILADVFGRNVETIPLHLMGRHFRDFRPLLDEHATQILAMADTIAGHAGKIGDGTLHSSGDGSCSQLLTNKDQTSGEPSRTRLMRDDNAQLVRVLRTAHQVCEPPLDAATIATWIDEAERRTWFLSEIMREGGIPSCLAL